ncbi:MAG TPA: hypothetical protein VN947_33670 [Polyangia bacterium]|nr:hypothetical protein [Polyangia bacterium]
MQRHEIRVSVGFVAVCVILGVVTFGIVPLVLILSRRNLPKIVDDEGLTLGDGTRIPWKACTHVAKVPGTTQLVFGGTTVSFPTFSIHHGKAILAEIRQRLGLSAQ